MASFYHTFTSARQTEPDIPTLMAQLRASDPTAGIQHTPGGPYTIKKDGGDWTPAQINAVQNILNTAPASSPQLAAKAYLDSLSVGEIAEKKALLKQINQIRSKLVPPLGALTVQDYITAIKTEIDTP
jgi:hypothetical protein